MKKSSGKDDKPTEADGTKESEEASGGSLQGDKVVKIRAESGTWSVEELKAWLDIYKLTPAKVKRACPQFVQSVELLAPGLDMPDDWAAIEKAALWAAQTMGIADHAWRNASAVMGTRATAIAVAVIHEKIHRALIQDSAPVSSPGGLLYWYANRAKTKGDLPFVNTLYGLLPKREKDKVDET